ncbi:ABC transporter permease [Clostridioides sp. ES-S-0005-03]|uniref:ABC transporter permease n=1 Tax=Clostridioides sp. ES-S-0005-03 TaxID=2770774 RepID=UPI001D0F51F4|nr:ABC transporter permease [Clostridioides sp. ES-S-0005-03]UDN47071.1 ABC transporter permease [Clostridioides sp. ES-S-0173-01]
MYSKFFTLIKKDFWMIIYGKFFILAFSSLILYSCYINFGYIKFMEEDSYHNSVYMYKAKSVSVNESSLIYPVSSIDDLKSKLSKDTNAVGIDASENRPKVILHESLEKVDNYRADYALYLLLSEKDNDTKILGKDEVIQIKDKDTSEMKLRKEMTCEILFFEIVAIGFLGIASLLFKEKQMGVMYITGILPVKRSLFILSKVSIFLICDLCFTVLLLIINIGFFEGIKILPQILVQTGILSIIMSLIGFGCSMLLKDFKQFSLAYLLVAVFITTPVFLSSNTSFEISWIKYHPFYHVYNELKNAFFISFSSEISYFIACSLTIIVLFLLVKYGFDKELIREG